MRILHISDLHFGKSLNEIRFTDEQRDWVDKFIMLTDEKKPDAVIIAGDIYDRSSPSDDAVQLFNRLLTGLSEINIPTMIVSGNHDSGQKLSFANKILQNSNIYIAGVISADMMNVTFNDEYGPVTFWLMPYIYPAEVARILDDKDIRDYETACMKLIERQNIDFSQRNIMIAHQNITHNGVEAERGGSESMVGGVGGIGYQVFEKFDYTALGHIHKSQKVGRDNIRYAGSPLCYHFDETKFPVKGAVLVELFEKGEDIKTEICEIKPLHPLKEIKGAYDEITENEKNNPTQNCYIKITLTDRRVSPEDSENLRNIFEGTGDFNGRRNNLLTISSEYMQFNGAKALYDSDYKTKSTASLFCDFFRSRSGNTDPDDKQTRIIEFASKQITDSDNTDDSYKSETDALADFIIDIYGGSI